MLVVHVVCLDPIIGPTARVLSPTSDHQKLLLPRHVDFWLSLGWPQSKEHCLVMFGLCRCSWGALYKNKMWAVGNMNLIFLRVLIRTTSTKVNKMHSGGQISRFIFKEATRLQSLITRGSASAALVFLDLVQYCGCRMPCWAFSTLRNKTQLMSIFRLYSEPLIQRDNLTFRIFQTIRRT